MNKYLKLIPTIKEVSEKRFIEIFCTLNQICFFVNSVFLAQLSVREISMTYCVRTAGFKPFLVHPSPQVVI